MNTHVLRIVLIVQLIFAASLMYVGSRARDSRREAYLELTHRVTSGQASEEELVKLGAMLPRDADENFVRALFGLPVERLTELQTGEPPAKKTGDFWIYYSANENQPVTLAEAQKLKGRVRCFVIEFTHKGTHGEMMEITR